MKRSQINNLIDRALNSFTATTFICRHGRSGTPTNGKPWVKKQTKLESTVWDGWSAILAAMISTKKDFCYLSCAMGFCKTTVLKQRSSTLKMFVVQPEQVTPWHFHWMKTEDLINRGGGRLEVELAWAADDEKSFDEREVRVQVDGITKIIPSGGKLILEPGESVTLPPKLCHQFCGHKGDKTVLAGEISSLNDDTKDNCFMGKTVDRTPIIEDEAPRYSLTGEYTIGAPKT